MQVPSVHLAQSSRIYDLRWLPGTTSLLAISSSGLARLDLDPAALPADQQLNLDWVKLPSGASSIGVCIDLVPGTSLVLVVLTHGLILELAMYDTMPITRLASWSDRVRRPAGSASSQNMHTASVRCLERLAAVTLGDAGTAVYELSGDVCKRLYWVDQLGGVSFSSCERFLAGLTAKTFASVLDARTGAPLVRLSPDDFWTGSAAGSLGPECSGAFRVTWTPNSKLRIVAKLAGFQGAIALSVCSFG